MSLHSTMQACRLGDLPTLQRVFSPTHLSSTEPGTDWTPLYCAGVFGHTEVVQFLLEQGADPNIIAGNGDSLLHFAIDSGQRRIVSCLLTHHANPSPQNRDGDSPLHHSSAKGDLKSTKILLSHHADVSLPNTIGRTPLHYAVLGGHITVARCLVVSGASPYSEDIEGVRPVDLCKTEEMRIALMAESRKSTPSTFLINPSPDPRDDSSPGPLTTSPRSSSLSNPSPLPDLLEFRSLEEKIQRLASINQRIKDTLRTSTSAYSSPESSLRLNPKPARLSTPETIIRDDGKFLSWLARYRLESVYPCLMEAGFDDLGQVVGQMKSDLPLNDDVLKTIGVEKQGWRAILLAALERERTTTDATPHIHTNDKHSHQCCRSPTPAPTMVSYPTLSAWLDLMGLGYLTERFQAAGYLEVEQLLFLMYSSHPLTDTLLQDSIGVDKVGHRHRILCRLREDAQSFDPALWPGGDSPYRENTPKSSGCIIV